MSFIKARNALVKEISKREGLRSQVKVGDLREMIKILIDLEVEAYLVKADGPLFILAKEASARISKKKAIVRK